MKKALITGITGQDGSFLAEFLLGKGYDVHGTIRRSSVDYRERIAHLEGHPNFHLHYADLGDSMSILQVVKKVKPTEIYNLAAQSHVQVSFDAPEFTADVDATGVLRILEAVRQCDLIDTCRIYQASTSEMFCLVQEMPQTEKTPFYPRSPYGVAKLYGHWITKNYRESYGLFACSGILFWNSSPERSPMPLHASSWACRIMWNWATWIPSVTGVTPRTMSVQCGSCSSRTSRTTMSSPPMRPVRYGNLWKRRFPTWASPSSGRAAVWTKSASTRQPARSSSRSTRSSSVRQRSMCFWAIRQRQSLFWAGSVRFRSPIWSQEW